MFTTLRVDFAAVEALSSETSRAFNGKLGRLVPLIRSELDFPFPLREAREPVGGGYEVVQDSTLWRRSYCLPRQREAIIES